MNLIDKTAPSQTESISFELDLHHSPEKVWRALTDPVLLTEWLLPVVVRSSGQSPSSLIVDGPLRGRVVRSSGQSPSSLVVDGPLRGRVVELKLEPGTAFAFKTQPYPGWDGIVSCRILETSAHRKLSYTWVVGDMLDTVVTFTLTPTASGTRLSLVQSGFKPDQKQNFGGARYGWNMMGGKLVDLLARIS